MEVQLTSDQRAFARRAVKAGGFHSEEDAYRKRLPCGRTRTPPHGVLGDSG